MRTVLFDSSFLMAIMEHPTTWYEDILESVGSFKPTVLDVVQQELANVSKGGGKRSRFAALALELSSNFTAVKARSKNGKPDDELISYAKEKRAMVATIDGELLERLAALRVPAITLRRGRVHV
ncbi:MAG: hypothetical protein HYY68_00370 [Thaumarchaeota archaeon]|nr:hypothetical protein [Nitrososphaerota archaeon]